MRYEMGTERETRNRGEEIRWNRGRWAPGRRGRTVGLLVMLAMFVSIPAVLAGGADGEPAGAVRPGGAEAMRHPVLARALEERRTRGEAAPGVYPVAETAGAASLLEGTGSLDLVELRLRGEGGAPEFVARIEPDTDQDALLAVVREAAALEVAGAGWPREEIAWDPARETPAGIRLVGQVRVHGIPVWDGVIEVNVLARSRKLFLRLPSIPRLVPETASRLKELATDAATERAAEMPAVGPGEDRMPGPGHRSRMLGHYWYPGEDGSYLLVRLVQEGRELLLVDKTTGRVVDRASLDIHADPAGETTEAKAAHPAVVTGSALLYEPNPEEGGAELVDLPGLDYPGDELVSSTIAKACSRGWSSVWICFSILSQCTEDANYSYPYPGSSYSLVNAYHHAAEVRKFLARYPKFANGDSLENLFRDRITFYAGRGKAVDAKYLNYVSFHSNEIAFKYTKGDERSVFEDGDVVRHELGHWAFDYLFRTFNHRYWPLVFAIFDGGVQALNEGFADYLSQKSADNYYFAPHADVVIGGGEKSWFDVCGNARFTDCMANWRSLRTGPQNERIAREVACKYPDIHRRLVVDPGDRLYVPCTAKVGITELRLGHREDDPSYFVWEQALKTNGIKPWMYEVGSLWSHIMWDLESRHPDIGPDDGMRIAMRFVTLLPTSTSEDTFFADIYDRMHHAVEEEVPDFEDWEFFKDCFARRNWHLHYDEGNYVPSLERVEYRGRNIVGSFASCTMQPTCEAKETIFVDGRVDLHLQGKDNDQVAEYTWELLDEKGLRVETGEGADVTVEEEDLDEGARKLIVSVADRAGLRRWYVIALEKENPDAAARLHMNPREVHLWGDVVGGDLSQELTLKNTGSNGLHWWVTGESETIYIEGRSEGDLGSGEKCTVEVTGENEEGQEKRTLQFHYEEVNGPGKGMVSVEVDRRFHRYQEPPANEHLPVADTWISESCPSCVFGHDDFLRIRCRPRARTLVRWDRSIWGRGVRKAVLHIYQQKPGNQDDTVYIANLDPWAPSASWTEDSSWDDVAPVQVGYYEKGFKPRKEPGWQEVDVTRVVNGAAKPWGDAPSNSWLIWFAFCHADDSLTYGSRESNVRPWLEITPLRDGCDLGCHPVMDPGGRRIYEGTDIRVRMVYENSGQGDCGFAYHEGELYDRETGKKLDDWMDGMNILFQQESSDSIGDTNDWDLGRLPVGRYRLVHEVDPDDRLGDVNPWNDVCVIEFDVVPRPQFRFVPDPVEVRVRRGEATRATVEVWNGKDGSEEIRWVASTAEKWLSLGTYTGTASVAEPSRVEVLVSAEDLPTGRHEGTVHFEGQAGITGDLHVVVTVEANGDLVDGSGDGDASFEPGDPRGEREWIGREDGEVVLAEFRVSAGEGEAWRAEVSTEMEGLSVRAQPAEGTGEGRFQVLGDAAGVPEVPVEGTVVVRLLSGPDEVEVMRRELPLKVDESGMPELEPASVDFGEVVAGSWSRREVVLRNTGRSPVIGEVTVEAPFEVLGGSPYRVEPGGEVTVMIGFAPEGEGGASGEARFSGGAGGAVLSLAGRGIAGTLCEDEDADGYVTCDGCAAPHLVPCGDCAEGDRERHPGAPEDDGNGEDDDCDGEVDELTVRLGLDPGWHLVGLALEEELTASWMCELAPAQAGEIDRVLRWKNRWRSYSCAVGLGDFPLESGRGYFLHVTNGYTWEQEGEEYASPFTVGVEKGWTLLSLPSWAAGKKASEVCEELEAAGCGPERVLHWRNRWRSYDCRVGLGDFELEEGEGFFVKGESACSWTVQRGQSK